MQKFLPLWNFKSLSLQFALEWLLDRLHGRRHRLNERLRLESSWTCNCIESKTSSPLTWGTRIFFCGEYICAIPPTVNKATLSCWESAYGHSTHKVIGWVFKGRYEPWQCIIISVVLTTDVPWFALLTEPSHWWRTSLSREQRPFHFKPAACRAISSLHDNLVLAHKQEGVEDSQTRLVQ